MQRNVKPPSVMSKNSSSERSPNPSVWIKKQIEKYAERFPNIELQVQKLSEINSKYFASSVVPKSLLEESCDSTLV